MNTYTDENTAEVACAEADKLRGLFIGRSIVAVQENTLTLDDGTKLEVKGSEGCGGCANGWFEIEHLSTFLHEITHTEVKRVMRENYVEEISLIVHSEELSAKVIVTAAEGCDGHEDVSEDDMGFTVSILASDEG